MKILVLNTGSSSIKFQVFEMPENKVLARGVVEKIGEAKGHISFTREKELQDIAQLESEVKVADHQEGLDEILKLLLDESNGVISDTSEIQAVGHRVVHGGEKFTKPTIIESTVLKELEKISYLAPLHNPACATGIHVAQSIFSEAMQVAVFDTAFHQSIPDFAYRYAIPESLYEEHGLRVYGFHGTSHQYVMKAAAKFLKKPLDRFNAITIHLGNGCSMAAIRNGQCVDTSMGLTPLGGLIMGSRSGDIDPSLILFLGENLDMEFQAIDELLNKKSGLKGLTGTNDLREILQQYNKEDSQAILAIEMYVYRIKKYIGAYVAALGKIDAIILTAGVGENSAFIREKVCSGLEIMGIELDTTKNHQVTKGIREIQASDGEVSILVVPTNEELEIAQQTFEVVRSVD